MVNRKPRTVLYRRKRENKTNYLKRLKLLLSRKGRLVVRFTNKKIVAQLVEFTPKGDKVLVGTDSFNLRKFGWQYSCKNLPAAYLTGLLFGKKVAEKKYKGEMVFDTGFKSPLHKGKYYAFLKGALDAGATIPHSGKDLFPDDKTIQGAHIQDYAGKLKKASPGSKVQFAEYLKSNAAPESMSSAFAQVKQKIAK
ncbi:MAG TPA: 50S ribosomal protein L18 [Candidatus Nanoarchaeia archaeon]|nr:50S ribosomal protein L18 [Candidatus Nanoarchaeia archaeon]